VKNIFFSSKSIKLSETKKAIIEELAERSFPLRNQGDKIKFSGDSITVVLADNFHATFDLNNDVSELVLVWILTS
jgi:hypothetical protein